MHNLVSLRWIPWLKKDKFDVSHQFASYPGWCFEPLWKTLVKCNGYSIIPNVWKNKRCSKPPTSISVAWCCMLVKTDAEWWHSCVPHKLCHFELCLILSGHIGSTTLVYQLPGHIFIWLTMIQKSCVIWRIVTHHGGSWRRKLEWMWKSEGTIGKVRSRSTKFSIIVFCVILVDDTLHRCFLLSVHDVPFRF